VNDQDRADLELGRIVRALFERGERITIRNLLDEGATFSFGDDQPRMSQGASIDDAADLAARRAGVMPHAKILRPSQPILPDSSGR
jgi:hypothetical protein